MKKLLLFIIIILLLAISVPSFISALDTQRKQDEHNRQKIIEEYKKQQE